MITEKTKMNIFKCSLLLFSSGLFSFWIWQSNGDYWFTFTIMLISIAINSGLLIARLED